MEKQDLRGVVTIVMILIFAAAIFSPPVFGFKLDTEFTQSVIQLTGVIVTFYFTNKATKDR